MRCTYKKATRKERVAGSFIIDTNGKVISCSESFHQGSFVYNVLPSVSERLQLHRASVS